MEVIDRDGLRIRLAMLITTVVSNRAGAFTRELDDGRETDNIFVGALVSDVTSPSVVVMVRPCCLSRVELSPPVEVIEWDGLRISLAILVSTYVSNLAGALTREFEDMAELASTLRGFRSNVVTSDPDVAVRVNVCVVPCGTFATKCRVDGAAIKRV